MVETADAMTAPGAWDEAPLPKRNGTKRILTRRGEGNGRCVRKIQNPDFVTERIFMGWETRERGSSYYTRSKWKGGRVVREYIGTGPLAEIVALDDELKRLQNEEEAAYRREERERLEQSAGFLRELEEACKVLTRAHLLAAGCRKRRGQWRRRRV